MKWIREHYVPVSYLTNFGELIYLYDRQTRSVSQSPPKKVAFQRNLYADSNDTALKLEGMMCPLEGSANTVISKIIGAESIAGLSDDDWAALYLFVAPRFARTLEYREVIIVKIGGFVYLWWHVQYIVMHHMSTHEPDGDKRA